jgi:hypothetical protein
MPTTASHPSRWARTLTRTLARTRTLTRTLTGAVALATLAACGTDAPTAVPGEGAGRADRDGPRLPNDVVLAWSTVAHDAFLAHDGYAHGNLAVRTYAMMHLAQHDAVNAVTPVYARYAYAWADRAADAVAAAAVAAHDVMVAVLPGQQPAFDAELARDLALVPDGAGETRGIALGRAAAAAILAARAHDGSDTPIVGDYVPGTGPGRYQHVSGFDFAFAPGWRHVQPFALTAPDQFRPGPPPALHSQRYTRDFQEVQAVGGAVSTVRTPDQTRYAKFWWEDSDRGWDRIGRIVAAERGIGLHAAARLFALLNMTMSDAYVAGWDAKFHYDFWRPVTAIRAADTDGNPATTPDPTWESVEMTFPIPDYPSTHSALGRAAAEVLASVFGDHTPFTFASTTADPAQPTRSFRGFREAADENADSRVVGGMHFRFATEVGQRLGRDVARWTLRTQLRALE